MSSNNLITNWIQCETTSDTIEIHRGRNGYEWKGQKGKELLWTLPVLIEKSADEILNKIYNCEYWRPIGKGRETSIKSLDLMEFIWNIVFSFIDIKNIRKVHKGDGSQISTNNAQQRGQYVIKYTTIPW